MRKSFVALVAFLLFSSHDMFLKFESYFLEPNTPAVIKLYNGTFDLSENIIDRNRMIDVSLVGNGRRTAVDSTHWREQDNTTLLDFITGDIGTWVAGVSTLPRTIELAAADFNDYLEHDGVLDMLKWRKENNATDSNAVEKYSKHVKAIFQVGQTLTDDWQTKLGYPIEFVPLNNPYNVHPGHKLQVQLLWQGQPLTNQLVYAGYGASNADHGHSHTDNTQQDHTHDANATGEDHQHDELIQLRTDAEGKIDLEITTEGLWYLRSIYLTHSNEPGLTHESNWATLTFEVGSGHLEGSDSHSHQAGNQHAEDDHDHSIPEYAYWIGSLALIAGLFFWFNRKNK